MVLFIVTIIVIAGLLFVASLYMIKLRQRREADPIFDKRLKKFEDRVDPYYKFLVNLFGWAFALLVFYYIYLG